jgi:hypothetical protein
MITIEVLDLKPDEIMPIVRALRADGLEQGRDFDFAYTHAKYDSDGWEAVHNRRTAFTFYKEEYATMFTLKYL